MKTFFHFAVAATAGMSCFSEIMAQQPRAAIQQPYTTLVTYSKAQSDAFSFTGNQAVLAKLKNDGAGIFSERRFLLSEAGFYALAAAFGTAAGNVGLQMNYTGSADFNEQKMGFAYAKNLGSKIDVGSQFDYYSYSIRGYKKSATVNVEIGMMLHLSSKLNAGVQLINPVNKPRNKEVKKSPAAVYKTGFGYDVSEEFFLTAGFIKEEDAPVNFTGGFQYHFQQQFFVRAGFSSDTGSGYAGAGLVWNKLRLDVTGGFHPKLGFSPGILLMLNLKKERK